MPSIRAISVAENPLYPFVPVAHANGARCGVHRPAAWSPIIGCRWLPYDRVKLDLELTGLRALVTGGSDGLGAAVARVLAAEGAKVAVAARASDRLSATASDIGASAIAADLAAAGGPADAVAASV